MRQLFMTTSSFSFIFPFLSLSLRPGVSLRGLRDVKIQERTLFLSLFRMKYPWGEKTVRTRALIPAAALSKESGRQVFSELSSNNTVMEDR